NMILKNIVVLKDHEEPNGTFVDFRDMGRIGRLITDSVYIDGVKTLVSDDSKIGRIIRGSAL
ncbi:MAG: hypothetical protein IIT95_01545, partial [Oscillospiraceae bacterium]|nr:hypothetical protein [Oscillospiraceae bacterium]